ncbi:MAG TPA: hypothetical protein VGO50_11810 [Pyrinomonadaceae bacterium]|jgi:hypothetical protein|nr:hypothetical protein [Pyrinomonadaceae bacterium]
MNSNIKCKKERDTYSVSNSLIQVLKYPVLFIALGGITGGVGDLLFGKAENVWSSAVFGVMISAAFLLGIPLLIIIVIILYLVLNNFFRRIKSVQPKEFNKAGNGTGKIIIRPPFSFLHNITHILPAKYARCLEQEISDLRLEYFEALAEGNTWRANNIVSSYYVGLGWSAFRWIAERVKELVGFMPKMN